MPGVVVVDVDIDDAVLNTLPEAPATTLLVCCAGAETAACCCMPQPSVKTFTKSLPLNKLILLFSVVNPPLLLLLGGNIPRLLAACDA